MNYFSPDSVFLFLVNSSGAIALLVYLVIAVSHLRMRKKIERTNPESLKIKMWFYPYLTYLTIIAICAILLSMLFISSMRSEFLLTGFITLLVLASYVFRKNKNRKRALPKAGLRTPQTPLKKGRVFFNQPVPGSINCSTGFQ